MTQEQSGSVFTFSRVFRKDDSYEIREVSILTSSIAAIAEVSVERYLDGITPVCAIYDNRDVEFIAVGTHDEMASKWSTALFWSKWLINANT